MFCFFVFYKLGLLGVRMSAKRYKQASKKVKPERPVQSLLEKAQHKYGSRLLVCAISQHVQANAKKLGKACPNDQNPGRNDQKPSRDDQPDQQTDLPAADKVLVSTRLLKEITWLIGFGSISSASLELRRLKVLQRIEKLVQSS